MSNKKKEILESVMKLVAANGFEKFSVHQMAQHAGVSDGLMYRFFSSVDEMYYIAFERICEDDLKQLIEIKKQYSESRERWNAWMKYLIEDDYHSLFALKYQDSPYYRRRSDINEKADMRYFRKYRQLSMEIRMIFTGSSSDTGVSWIIMNGASRNLVRKVLEGDMTVNEEMLDETYEAMSQLFH